MITNVTWVQCMHFSYYAKRRQNCKKWVDPTRTWTGSMWILGILWDPFSRDHHPSPLPTGPTKKSVDIQSPNPESHLRSNLSTFSNRLLLHTRSLSRKRKGGHKVDTIYHVVAEDIVSFLNTILWSPLSGVLFLHSHTWPQQRIFNECECSIIWAEREKKEVESARPE